MIILIHKGYLCKPNDNVYGIEFVRFKIRDVDTDLTLFEVCKPPDSSNDHHNHDEEDDDESRFIRYEFADSFLRIKNIGAT